MWDNEGPIVGESEKMTMTKHGGAEANEIEWRKNIEEKNEERNERKKTRKRIKNWDKTD